MVLVIPTKEGSESNTNTLLCNHSDPSFVGMTNAFAIGCGYLKMRIFLFSIIIGFRKELRSQE